GVPVAIGRTDLRGESAEIQQARLAALREARSHRVLPSDRPPLLAVDATLLAADRIRLHVGHDGLVMDGTSMFLFFDDWWRCYTGTAEPAAEVGFAEYVDALEGMRAKPPRQRSTDYWLERIPGLPPHPGLPLRASPSAISRPRFVQHTARLD